ncbi:MAG: PQQ-dependent sugar dehydrogenase [Candidatus Eisenbacteria bacterium]
MARSLTWAGLALTGGLLVPSVTGAVSAVPTRFADQAVTQDLYAPTSLAILPDGRILVVEQRTGRIVLVPNGGTPTPSLGLAKLDSVSTDGFERGLLGIAIDSAWPGRPYVYVLYDCTIGPALRLSRYTVTGDLTGTGDRHLGISLASRYDLLVDLPDQSVSHNGGTVRFGRDGMLLVSLGDDFSDCQAQDLTVLVGKVLRLDVSRLPTGPGGPASLSLLTPADNPFVANPDPHARLVWAYGMRNPFRLQVDSVTGAVFITDVGASTYEEIDRLTQGGANLGWPYYEGPAPYESCTGTPGPLTAPVYVYDRSQVASSASLALGVYHVVAGAPLGFPPACDGSFFLADYEQGFVRRLVLQGGAWVPATMPGQPDDLDFGTGFNNVTDGAEGPDGTFYYTRQAPLGEVRRIWYDTGPVAVDPVASPQTRLDEPFPMPGRGTIHFAFELPGPRVVTFELLDLQGRRLRPLIRSALMEPGRHEVPWDGRWTDGTSAPAGVYFARLSTDGRSLVRRFVWIR